MFWCRGVLESAFGVPVTDVFRGAIARSGLSGFPLSRRVPEGHNCRDQQQSGIAPTLTQSQPKKWMNAPEDSEPIATTV